MKALSLLFSLILLTSTLSSADTSPKTETYGIHLFFNEQEFVDVMSLTYDKTSAVKGFMHVPNDFDGPLENIMITGQEITFDLFVPKNSARPEDLTFHYKGQFFDASKKQIIGYVTLKDQADFVASFTGFLRP